MVDGLCERATRFAVLVQAAGVEVLAHPVLNQLPVAFGIAPHEQGHDAITDAVIVAIQAEGTLWAGASTWRGKRILRLSVSDASTTSDDIEAAALAIVGCWESVIANLSSHRN